VGPEALQHTFILDWRAILIQIVAFVILVMILRKFLFGPVTGFIAQRQAEIQGNMERALSERQQMEQLRAEYSDRLTRVEAEARDKIQSALQDAQQIREEIVGKARDEAETLLQRSREEIQREKQRALIELRAQVADMAVDAASRILQRQIDASVHRELVNDFVAKVSPQ
jgi:F-type H+-transporting ATPase subunit b